MLGHRSTLQSRFQRFVGLTALLVAAAALLGPASGSAQAPATPFDPSAPQPPAPGSLAALAGAQGGVVAGDPIPGQYVVVLEDSVARPGRVAEAQVEQRDGELGFVYRLTLNGYSAELSPQAVASLRDDPRVRYVVADRKVEALAQSTPTGVRRIGAATNPALDIDEQDDVRVNADVAVLDTGIDFTHPDLNVVSRTNCVPPGEEGNFAGCVDNSGTDDYWHGTHVAGTVGALDNGVGVVGVAPGARLWAVKVLRADGVGDASWILGGIEWVTAHASQIEVANMSLGAPGYWAPEAEAITDSLNAGVVYAVAAMNNSGNAEEGRPASHPGVITVSALADYDGQAGGKSGSSCIHRGFDDTTATFSNWGDGVDIAAPGVCINSTLPEGKYGSSYGTSMATPHVAGAAALIASQDNPNSKADVDEIRDALVDGGSHDWSDSAEDSGAEPLLHLGTNPLTATEAAIAGVTATDGKSATLHGAVNGRGLATEYHFEYGPTPAYGSKAPASPKAIGATAGYTTVAESIAGLEPGDTYHYRLVAKNSSGTFHSADRVFTASRWKADPLASQPGSDGNEWLNDLDCVSATSCMAVGHYYKENENRVLAYELKNGKWEWRSVPLPSGGFYPELSDVSCSSASACTAVGQAWTGSQWVAMAARWNGSAWTSQALSSPAGATTAMLSGVSCSTSTSCIAVGYVKDAAGDWVGHSVQWNGSAWSNLSTPTAVDWDEGELKTVSCTAANACTAVGWYNATGGGSKPRILRWSGSAWSAQTPARGSGSLEGIDCVSAQFCVAVGGHPTVEVWDGTKWSLQTTASLGGEPSGYFYDVSCVSPEQCSAVGSIRRGPRYAPLVQRWNGSAWTVQAMPKRAEWKDSIWGVSCSGLGGCRAVGGGMEGTWNPLILSRPYPASEETPDLVAIDDGGVSVYRGDEDGIVIPSPTRSLEGQLDLGLPDGEGHHVVDVADVGGDGELDLVTVKEDGKVLVHPGTGNRSFGAAAQTGPLLAPATHDAGGDEPIAVADVTGDDRADLVVFAGPGTAAVEVYAGQSNGMLSSSPVTSLSLDSALRDRSGLYFLDVADVDGDGRADLVTMNTGSTGNEVFRGQANGTFVGVSGGTPNPVMDDGSGSEPVGVGDVDGDGRADLLTHHLGTLYLQLGQSSGNLGSSAIPFAGQVDSSLLDGEGEELIGLLDYNRDGRADLVALEGGDLVTYRAKVDGTFAAPVSVAIGLGSLREPFGDALFTLEKPFLRSLGCTPQGCPWPPVAVDSDVDGDRRADLVDVHHGGARVFAGTAGGFGTNSPVTSLKGSFDPALLDGHGDYVVDSADVDGDRRADLVTLGGEGGVEVHAGRADRTFAAPVASLATLKPSPHGAGGFEPIAAADINRDGRADLVGFSTASGGSIASYLGQGDSTFGFGSTSQAGQVDSALADGQGDYFLDLADVDGDWDADLVSIASSGALRTYRSTGGNSFSAATISVPTVDPVMDDGEGHEPIGLADVNRDGRADLVSLHGESGKAFVFPGQGDGRFGYPQAGPEGYAPAADGLDSSLLDGDGEELVGLLDHDGDRRADLVSFDADGDVVSRFVQANGTFGSPTVRAADVVSLRANPGGDEPAAERPLFRRAGCAPDGCVWPPRHWSSKKLPPPAQRIEDTHCLVAADCLGAGSRTDAAGVQRAQLARWNGSAWMAVPTPTPAGSGVSELSGVSCTSASLCAAVGSYVDSAGATKALALTWNGTAWSVASTPTPSGASDLRLADVSCNASGACIGVGSKVVSGSKRLFTVRWEGGAWTEHLQGAPGTSSEMKGISCLKAGSSCAAVGSYVDGGVTKAMIYLRVFTIWAIGEAPLPEGATSSSLADVSCTAALTDCIAVGSYVNSSGTRRTLAMKNSASGWQVVASPHPAGATASELAGVSCLSGSDCFAAGSYDSAAGKRPLALRWNGTAWSEQTLGLAAGADGSSLAGISCATGSSCAATGSASYADGASGSLAYRYDGSSWVVTEAGRTVGTALGISCPTAASCTVVGGIETPHEVDADAAWTLANGEWTSAQRMADLGESGWHLRDVACGAADKCTAVGFKDPNSSVQVAERLEGGQWVAQTLPSAGSSSTLRGVDCVGAPCAAVGSYSSEGVSLPLAQMTGGAAWVTKSVPTHSGATFTTLNDVSCTATTFCLAVGRYLDAGGVQRPFGARWDGTAWSTTAVPAPVGAVHPLLSGVSCSAANACTAVGSYLPDESTPPVAYAVRWDGSTWQSQSGAMPLGVEATELQDVDCATASGCVAVGRTRTGDALDATVMAWDGASWQVEPAGAPSVGDTGLTSVSCNEGAGCVAAGYHQQGSSAAPIVLAPVAEG